jgi:hypothetical protein
LVEENFKIKLLVDYGCGEAVNMTRDQVIIKKYFIKIKLDKNKTYQLSEKMIPPSIRHQI